MNQGEISIDGRTVRSIMPVGFIGHGSPMNAIEHEGAAAAWRAWGGSLPRPRAVLIVSAHWLEAPPVVSGEQSLPFIYDFYGFPRELYQVQYATPGAPDLAKQVFGLLEKAGLKPKRSRPGAWTTALGCRWCICSPTQTSPLWRSQLGRACP